MPVVWGIERTYFGPVVIRDHDLGLALDEEPRETLVGLQREVTIIEPVGSRTQAVPQVWRIGIDEGVWSCVVEALLER